MNRQHKTYRQPSNISPSYTLQGAVGNTYTHPEHHDCNFYRPCRWRDNCRFSISCNTVSQHYAQAHGITNIGELQPVTCHWFHCGRVVSRKGFVRHIREYHLLHERIR
ncbi:hypothetical protein SCLCIDRAFT_974269 [Scleroderma citrinum Foug A]|uniref:Uncharacterized protein n=1 Tax=Scleroderma citrinum Foug A TaxID=1036808 RepID=A0A0C3DVJ3_9AGAM|nr:hypothetical protein SCLCIDRAFT_974269 [Scleroderma citrinum Foug A]